VSVTRATISRCVLIWLTSLVTYGYFSTVINDNVQTRAALTLSLVQRHAVDINTQSRFTQDKAYTDGNYYSDKAPGLSLLAVPAALVLAKALDPGGTGAAWVASDALTPRYGMLVYLLTLSTVGLLASLAVVATYAWNIAHGSSQTGALLAAATLGLATPFFGWATVFLGHAASGSLLLLGFLALLLADQAARRPWAPPLGFGAGIALGTAFCVEFPAGPAVAIIGMSCGGAALSAADRWTRARRVFVPAAVGLILAIVPLAIYNDVAFHSPLTLGYDGVQDFAGMREGFFGVRLPDLHVAWALIGGLYRGLLPLSPVLMLFPIAAFVAFRDRAARLPALVGVLVFAYYLAMNAGYFYWDGGSSTGPRHLIPALPFMTLLLARLWDVSHPAPRIVFLGLFGISLAISLICASVDIMSPPDYARPFTDYLLPGFLKGHLHRLVIGRLLPGINALPFLIPLVLLWGVAAWRLCTAAGDRRQEEPFQ
jgi:hypothetical protein